MTREEKQLLFKDLCSRLPYGVRYKGDGGWGINPYQHTATLGVILTSEEPLVYLRSMSSMTEEEAKEVCRLENFENRIICVIPNNHTYHFTVGDAVIDWLNEHHFDYRGLIEKGLALEAPKNMYKEN